MKNKSVKIAILTIGIIILVSVISVIVFFIWYNSGKKAVSKENGQIIKIEIEEGSSANKIATLLKENNVIKNANVMKIYTKLNNIKNLQAGKYAFNNSENLESIIYHLKNGEVLDEEIKITFIEGKNMRYIAKVIANNTVNTEEDVFNLLNDEEYIDSLIDKYWFLTDDIKNDDIYYPLEGYLLPDTYIFENREVSVKTIFNVILNYMDNFLKTQQNQIKTSIHELLTFASITELEGVNYEDRQEIIGVLLNRISKKMSLGSDVTAYYALKVEMGERDLYAKELNTSNPYNTRGPNMEGKLPIGPICNPSKDAILATINYKESENLYFVADKNKKIYFTKSYEDHIKIIKELKQNNLWYEYK